MSPDYRLTPDEARSVAKTHCGDDCLWYHGLWPLLRRLGLGTAPEDHAAFYTAGLKDAANDGAIVGGAERVLVCGAADSAMPRLVQRVLSELGSATELVVLDRCATPLAITSEEFARDGLAALTVRGEVLEAQFAQPFDLIVTHSFLGYFSEPEREALLRRWADWLRPGGRVLTVNRLRRSGITDVRFTAAEAEAFVERVAEALNRTPEVTRLTVSEVRDLARRYAERFRIRALTSLDDLARRSRAAGLALETRPLGQLGRPGPSGPSAPGGAEYYGLIFRR